MDTISFDPVELKGVRAIPITMHPKGVEPIYEKVGLILSVEQGEEVRKLGWKVHDTDLGEEKFCSIRVNIPRGSDFPLLRLRKNPIVDAVVSPYHWTVKDKTGIMLFLTSIEEV